MKILQFIISLLLIYEIPFYLVEGKTITKEKNDCTKLSNFLNNDSKDYENSYCKKNSIRFDNEGYISSLFLSWY